MMQKCIYNTGEKYQNHPLTNECHNKNALSVVTSNEIGIREL